MIPHTLLSVGSNFTDAHITEFDTALLKTIFSDKIEYGMNRRVAAEKIAKLVFKELRR